MYLNKCRIADKTALYVLHFHVLHFHVIFYWNVEATNELFRICRLMWRTEHIPPDLVRGVFMMIYNNGPRDDFANYRAICLLCHSYKLLSAVIARRLMEVLDGHLPDTQAGFRAARGCRDNVCALASLSPWCFERVGTPL